MTLTLERLCLYCDNTTDQGPRPDPFDSQVYGDSEPIDICDDCYDERKLEV